MFKLKCLQGKDRWLLLLTLGAVCCILAFPTEWMLHGQGMTETGRTSGYHDADDGKKTVFSLYGENAEVKDRYSSEAGSNQFQTILESRVQKILEHVEGIGKVEVMIIQEEKKQSSGLFEGNEERVFPITGMVVCADGGGSPVVQAEIYEAMEALFGLPAHKIKVLKRVE